MMKENETSKTKAWPWRKWCRGGPGVWCIKYFWEGQLSKSTKDDEEVIVIKEPSWKMTPGRRKIMAFLIPVLIVHFGWWSVMISNNYWYIFKDRYPMSITMIIGSLVAGMTSEGGGAVAFPVMTLALGISPAIARDFSFMVQTTGMSAVTFCINFMRIKIEKNSLIFCTAGGVAGLIFGFNLIDPNLTPAQKKMGFVSIWFSFAFSLYLLNRNHKRKTFYAIPNMNMWKSCILLFTGFVGGCFTSFAGSGLDICSFSILCLLFRVSEKVATPTSVILMATNSIIGLFWRAMVMQEVDIVTWEYIMACIPIVVMGAPFGALMGSHFHRLVLASFVYIIDVAALIGAFAIVPQTPLLAGVSCGIIVVFLLFFLMLTKLGTMLMEKELRVFQNKKADDKEDDQDKTPADIVVIAVPELDVNGTHNLNKSTKQNGVNNLAFE